MEPNIQNQNQNQNQDQDLNQGQNEEKQEKKTKNNNKKEEVLVNSIKADGGAYKGNPKMIIVYTL